MIFMPKPDTEVIDVIKKIIRIILA